MAPLSRQKVVQPQKLDERGAKTSSFVMVRNRTVYIALSVSAWRQSLGDTILVVEDEGFIRLDVVQHLTECGFQVLEASDALEAIRQIQAHPEIALVFTDVRMPGPMDGLGLVKWVTEYRPEIVAIVASGDLGRVTAMKELCGAHAFPKPYLLDDLTKTIRNALTSRQR